MNNTTNFLNNGNLNKATPKRGLPIALIAGGIGVLLLIVIVIVVWWYKNRSEEDSAPEDVDEDVDVDSEEEPMNCKVSNWSEWKPCSEGDACTGEFRERVIESDENELGSCIERSNLKETRSGKMCGETTGTYCFMPLGEPCAIGKDIPRDLPNGGRCQEAVKEVAGISQIQSYTTVRVPKNCSYRKTDTGAHMVGHGAPWSSAPFSEHMAVCLN